MGTLPPRVLLSDQFLDLYFEGPGKTIKTIEPDIHLTPFDVLVMAKVKPK